MTVNVTTTCRDIDELSPVAQKAVRLLFQECLKANIQVFVTETYRPQGRQNYLYEQGRSRAGNIVTWTKSSRHTSRLAWDIAASTLNGNTNIYNTSIIKKVGAIAKNLNIIWGGTWVKNLDYPHFEVPANWTIPKGYSLEGKVSIPTKSNVPITMVAAVSLLPKVPLVVEDKELEEDLKLTNYIPKISDMTSPTLKSSIITMLQNAKANGSIMDDKWVNAAEDGNLSMVDLIGLMIHTQVNTKMRDITSPTLKESVIKKLEQGEKDGKIKDKKWKEDAQKGVLNIADLLALFAHIEN